MKKQPFISSLYGFQEEQLLNKVNDDASPLIENISDISKTGSTENMDTTILDHKVELEESGLMNLKKECQMKNEVYNDTASSSTLFTSHNDYKNDCSLIDTEDISKELSQVIFLSI